MKPYLLTACIGIACVLAVPFQAEAQGVVRGAQEGAAVGNRAAGPVGGAVGGAVGGVAHAVVIARNGDVGQVRRAEGAEQAVSGRTGDEPTWVATTA